MTVTRMKAHEGTNGVPVFSPVLTTDIGLPNLAMMGTIPLSINGERLVIQHLSCIAGRTWLYRFGRMPSYLLVPAPFKDVSQSEGFNQSYF